MAYKMSMSIVEKFEEIFQSSKWQIKFPAKF